ncbi:MAG: redox-regulated ATPase YchF [Actinomycetota bacterium]
MRQAGIAGLPNSGKSTLFNALTHAGAEVAGHPFTTVDPNLGMANVPDARLRALAEVLGPERVVQAQVRFVDIAGLVRGAHEGEGLGNRFLGHIREVDAIVLLLRWFASDTVPHPTGRVDPLADLETLHAELALADLGTVGRASAGAAKRAAATKDRAEAEKAAALELAASALERGLPVSADLSQDQLESLRDVFLLTAKPFLYVLNVSEADLPNADALISRVRSALPEGAPVLAVCARLEAEAADLPDEDAAALLAEFGVRDRATQRIADAVRQLLGLITFYSIESSECRAWLVREGTTARDAAAEIHTDMAEGFIKAEVVPADELVRAGSISSARERGNARVEGRDYVVRDGDVLTFRFRG